jgi:hypothetical protein
MFTQKRTSIQNQLEQLLASQGELEVFKTSQIYRTEIFAKEKCILRIVKFHNLITCYYQSERSSQAENQPSITISISDAGKWRYVARHRARTFSRQLKAA